MLLYGPVLLLVRRNLSLVRFEVQSYPFLFAPAIIIYKDGAAVRSLILSFTAAKVVTYGG